MQHALGGGPVKYWKPLQGRFLPIPLGDLAHELRAQISLIPIKLAILMQLWTDVCSRDKHSE
jgi:hypothetical protein